MLDIEFFTFLIIIVEACMRKKFVIINLKVAILPPTLSLASRTTTSSPKDLSCWAAVRPAMPAPRIKIRIWICYGWYCDECTFKNRSSDNGAVLTIIMPALRALRGAIGAQRANYNNALKDVRRDGRSNLKHSAIIQ